MKNLFYFFLTAISIGFTFTSNPVKGQAQCASPSPLTIGANDGVCNSRTFSTLGADLDANTPTPVTALAGGNTCGAAISYAASWYSFTGDGTTIRVKLFNQNNLSRILVFQNATCGGSMTPTQCANFPDDNLPHTIDINTVNGATYRIAVMRQSGSASMSGAICAYKTNGNPYSPSCDPTYIPAPLSMVVQPDPLACFTNYTKTVSLLDNPATTDPYPVPGGSCGAGTDWLWGTFTATSTYTNFYYWGKEEDNMNVSLLAGPCVPTMTSLFCQNTGSEDFPTWAGATTVPGQQYYIVIRGPGGISDGRMCVYGSPTPEPTKPFCQDDMSFESGTGAGWTARSGPYRTDAGWQLTNAGSWNTPKFELTTGGCDPTVNCALPKVAPGGGNRSFRIGTVATSEGDGGFAAAQSMEYCFTVTPQTAGFGYKYAVVMDHVAHLPWQQPEFQVFVEGACPTGSVIQCGNFIHQPNDGVTKFQFVGDWNDVNGKSGGPIFSPWQDVAMDLSGFIGQQVKVVFRVKDCSGGGGTSGTCPIGQTFVGSCPPECTSTSTSGGNCTCNGCTGTTCAVPADNCAVGTHWAYAYFDTYCIPMTITVPEFCAGAGSIQICAPAGYNTYSWPAGQPGLSGSPTTQCVTITNPIGGTEYTVNMTSITGCPTTMKVKIKNIPVSKTTDTTVCAPISGSIPLSVTVTNATDPPYTYTWSNGLGSGQNKSVSPTSTTTYTVTITNKSGCTSTETITVTVNTCGPSVTTTGSPVCPGGCTNLTATGSAGATPYTYSWSNGLGTGAGPKNVCPANTTTYTVTMTDNTGLTATDTAVVMVHPAVTVTTSKTDVTCNGANNGSATATPGGGTSPYTYAWSPSGGTGVSTPSTLSPGTYTITVTDNKGCTRTATAVIAEPTPVTVTTTATDVSCNGGNNGTATATPGGGTSPYTYAWSPSGGTGISAGTLTAGTYTVTVTDNKGCTRTATAVVNQPTPVTASTTSTNVACAGGNNGTATVTPGGGTSPYTYAWSPSGGTGAIANTLTAGTYTATVTDNRGCTRTATAVITEPAPLTASTTKTDITCNGGSDGTATVTPGGGTSPYTYAWTPSGGTGISAGTLTAGTYTVTVTDLNGCTRTATAVISEPTAIALTTGSSPANCGVSDGSATVNPTGGTSPYTYSWSPAGGTANIANNVPGGSYTVTVTDIRGCTRTTVVVVSSTGAATVTLSKTDVSCFGGTDGTITSTVTGGSTPYTFSWTPSGGTGANANGLSAGTYTVVVTDNIGCITSTSIAVGQPPAITLVTGKTDANCGGSDGVATVTPSGGNGGPYTYSWSPVAGTNPTLPNIPQGIYTVVITDGNGCTTDTTVSVGDVGSPTLSLTATHNLCNGQSNGTATSTVTGGVSPYTYLWSGGEITPNIAGLSAGTYTLTVQGINGCSISQVITITEPSAMNATTSNTDSNCGASDGSVSVTVTGGTGTYSYLWSNSATTAIVNGVPSGGYTVTITDANGCTLTAAAAVSDIGAPSVNATVTNVLCNGGSDGTVTSTVTLGITPYTYTWSNNATTPNLANVPAGTYILTVTAANGCKATTSVTITEPTAIMLSTNKVDESCGYANGSATVTATGGTSPYVYSWNTGSTNATAPNLNAGTYTVTITDNNGCTKTTTESVANIPGPDADFSTMDKCVNDPVPFTNLSSPTAVIFGWDFGDATTSALNIPSPHTYTTPGTYTVWLRVSDAGGCLDSISKTVTIYALPNVNFLDTASGCSPLQVYFINQSDSASGTGYIWRFGDGSLPSTVKDPSHLYINSTQNPLQFSVSLIVTSPQGCVDSLTRNNIITVYPNPVASFTMDPTTTEILAPTISFFDQSSGAVSWFWEFGDDSTSTVKNPKHTYSDTGTYTVCLTITNAYGCTDRTCNPVTIKPIWTFYIPNAFTPDDDGVNDKFGGTGYGITQYELYIFDRWGDLVFKSTSITTQWDGMANGGTDPAQEDVYVYLAIVRDVFGARHRYTGSVTLVR